MTPSTLIARLVGPVFLIIGIGLALGMLMEGDAYSGLMKEFIASRALIYLTGILALAAGLAIVNTHNLWVPDWRVLVTILGWLFIIRGISNLVFPGKVQDLGDRMMASHGGLIAGAVVTLVLGAILTVKGYEALWSENRRRSSTSSVARSSSAKRPARRK
jgi:hypothetical protein